jgi:caffeoyl-CoA O-methyltransferase
MHERARVNADRAGVGDRVTLVTGPALETLAGIAGPFDFAYIDADKGSYPQYLDAVVERLRPGGVVALDNLLWLGQAAHEPEDSDFSRESTPIIRVFNEAFLADARLDTTIVQVGDGIGLGVKRRSVD